MQSAIAFAFKDSNASSSKKAAVFLERVLNQQDGDSDGDTVMRSRSNRESDSDESDSELSALALETGNVPEDDKSMKRIKYERSI